MKPNEGRVVRVAFVVGVAFAIALVGGLWFLARPHTTSTSGTAEGYGCASACVPPYLRTTDLSFPAGVTVEVRWSDGDGTTGALNFQVSPVAGGPSLGQTATGGSIWFLASGGSYSLGVFAADHQLGLVYANFTAVSG